MKLKVNDIIEVYGWVMLNKIKEGKYKVIKIGELYGKPIYYFSRPKGKKIIAGHYASDVDLWIQENNPNLNKIEIIR